MKRKILTGIFVFVILTCLNVTIFAEVSLSGNTQVSITILPTADYTSTRFESLLNPGNIMDLHDISFKPDFTAKVSAENDRSAFDFWFSVEPTEATSLLLSLFSGSSTNPDETAAFKEMLKSSPDTGLIIERADISWFLSDSLSLTVGRQDLFTGYGYGWNPINFAGREKDPFNPKAELSGTNAASLTCNAGNLLTLRSAIIYDPQYFESGINYNDIKAFAQITVSFPLIEITIDGLYYSLTGDDPAVPAAGAGFMADIGGFGVYGESALLERSRNRYPDASGNLNTRKGVRYNLLAGLEYTFPWDMNSIIEYFYNGEGFNITDRKNYYNLAKSLENTYILYNIVSLMKPGYFSQNYLLIYIMQPVYSINSEASLSVVYSPDSCNLVITPLFSINASGNLTVQIGYAGMFSIKDNLYNETDLSPLKHAVTFKAQYSF